MKKIVLAWLFLLSCYWGNAQSNYSLNLLDTWDNNNLPTHNLGTYNDCWGYAADGREYAILGSASFVHIFDVTDPQNVVEVNSLSLGPSTIWRDFKVYQDRLYCSADGSQEGLSIIDLSQLPESVSIIKQDNSVFSSAHNLYIEVERGRLYVVGSGQDRSVIVYDLNDDPDNPVLLGTLFLQNDYVHDIYVRDNIAYCSSEYKGLFIWDLTDVDNPELLATLTTNGYNHSNWLSDDGQTLVLAEEVPLGLPMLTIDVSGMMDNDLEIVQTFKDPNILDASTTSDFTPHNPYILKDLMIASYYEDGVHVYDWSDPSNPVKLTTYDTYPDNDIVGAPNYGYNGYTGCWGVYPFLPSGNIIASDMDYGLFVLELVETIVSTQQIEGLDQLEVFPNPTRDELQISFQTNESLELDVQLSDMSGKILLQQKMRANGFFNERLDLSRWSTGMYLLKIQHDGQQLVKKVTKF